MREQEKLVYTLEQAAEVMQISRPTMLNLVNKSGFPSSRVGRRWMIPVDELQRWLGEQVELAQVERAADTPMWRRNVN